MNDIWFTSDTHFNHKNCLLFRKQFASLDEMNDLMIERWNERVRPGDRVYHLGDFALGPVEEARKIAERLNGQIYLIRGNHERVAEKLDRWIWIKDYFGLKVGDQKIYLCHYAFRTWNCMHHGSWHLHGHSHGSLPELETSRSFDVGVDCWEFRPISYDQVAAKMGRKRFEPVDHHVLNTHTGPDSSQNAPEPLQTPQPDSKAT